MLVWRVEYPCGDGFYRYVDGDFSADKMDGVRGNYQSDWDSHIDWHCHPEDDGIRFGRDCGDSWFFGFESIRQAKNWFYNPGDCVLWARALDMRLAAYEAFRIIRGRRCQVVFEGGRRVASWDLRWLYRFDENWLNEQALIHLRSHS